MRLARFGRFVHLHTFRFGMHEEGQAVDTFLVVGGIAQQVANRTGFQAGAHGGRQARYALGQRGVVSPVDLLDVTAIKSGQRQEQDGYPMSYFYLSHNFFVFNCESRFIEWLSVTLLSRRQ